MSGTFQGFVEYSLFMTLRAVARRLSYGRAGRLGGFLGRLVYSLTPFRKKVTLDNLAHAFPEKSPSERHRIARGAYANYGTALIEFFWAAANSAEDVMQKLVPRGDETARKHLKDGKGVIFLSGHFGSWELMAASLGLHLQLPFLIVVQEQRNKMINAVIEKDRCRHGNNTVPMSKSVRDIIQTLGRGGIAGILADQSGPKESTIVQFFGRPCAAHRGVAAFSIKLDAPIVMVFPIRQDDGTYVADIEELDRTGLEGSSDEQIEELTRRHTAVLERYVRKYPDHWLWMHKRWKHTAYFESIQAKSSARHAEEEM
ncbi:MAG: lysophospholipid acyltransferase family protein [Bacteroidetes bacterium]|nr:lysophospholipid acyltransferase family protein [Bacteroidota bacterium]